MDDLFLKIISGEIPSAKIYEDEHTFAFLDIHPNNKGHVLVIPKKKYRNVFDIEPEMFAAMTKTAQKVAIAIKNTLSADGVNITMNNEAAAGQEVFHAHIHVIPRYENDHIWGEIKKSSYDQGEAEQFAEKIRTAL